MQVTKGSTDPRTGCAAWIFLMVPSAVGLACGQAALPAEPEGPTTPAQPGPSPTPTETTPTEPPSSLGGGRGFVQLAAGDSHACGLRGDGSVACWGDNGYRQATPPAGSFTQITAATSHSCGLTSDGRITCWGSYGAATAPSTA